MAYFITAAAAGSFLDAFLASGKPLGCVTHQGRPGNPAIFHRRYREELLALRGDRGGSAVIRRHEDVLTLLEADPRELQDADTPEALERIREGSKLPG